MNLESGRKHVWRLVRLGTGWFLTIVGLALLFLPGPGILFLLPGLTLLSAESLWVRRLLRRMREQRHVRRAMREAERVGFKIDPGPDEDQPGGGPPRPAAGS
jgi:hypothetical protein